MTEPKPAIARYALSSLPYCNAFDNDVSSSSSSLSSFLLQELVEREEEKKKKRGERNNAVLIRKQHNSFYSSYFTIYFFFPIINFESKVLKSEWFFSLRMWFWLKAIWIQREMIGF